MLSLLLCVPFQATAPPALEDLGTLVERVLEAHDVPALWAGRVELDGLVAAGVRGVRLREGDEAALLGDRLHLGSCSKSMTASLVGILAQRDVLSFDDSIASFYPDLDVHAGWKAVTLQHLLSHRGGAPADLTSYGMLGRFVSKHTGEPPAHRQMLAAGLLAGAPKSAPGEAHVYSNDGYALIGGALEQATSKSWRSLIEQELFRPLGIETFGFGPPDELADQPVGHSEAGVPTPKTDNPPAYGPAGRVHMSLADWGEYVAWHLRGAKDDTSLLSREGFHRLHTPSVDPSYACGWVRFERSWSAESVLYHNGSNTLWVCAMWLAPAEGVAFIAATNQGGPAAAAAVDAAVLAMILQRAAPESK